MTMLSEPLLAAQQRESRQVTGTLMVTVSALLFGVVAAFVKATGLPMLVMLQFRSLLEWLLALSAAKLYSMLRGVPVFPQAEVAKAEAVLTTPNSVTNTPSCSPRLHPRSEDTDPFSKSNISDFTLLLIGPPELRGWLVLRALLYWGFLACWWLALTSMPIGDATTIVYTGPIWTALFARICLKEEIDVSFYPIVLLDAVGLVLITQPSFLFSSTTSTPPPLSSKPDDDSDPCGRSYLLGACSALLSAVIAGLLPVCTRLSKRCFWTAVNHVSDALSAFLFTPCAFLVWFAIDPTAYDQTASSIRELLRAGSSPADDLPHLTQWTCLLGATLTGFTGLALQTLGYQRVKAAKASVMTILEIPFAYLLQAVLFHETLSAIGLVGVALVIGGSMINLWKQMRQKR
jgi:drug/metabolite transporter (DMT)-like permease